MIYSSYKEWRKARDDEFYWTCREHLIECAHHVMSLCPLPEFVRALEILEWFHKDPKDGRRRATLQRIYAESFRGRAWERFGNTSTVAGSLHLGFKLVLGFALNSPTAMTTSHTYYFAEAVAIAADKLEPHLRAVVEANPHVWWENRGRQSEMRWQDQQHEKLFPPYYERFKDSWKEYKKAHEVEQEAA
jgi:hypothetical protein